MRPVDKGNAPRTDYKKYQDAESDLEKRLGPYCSFCEMCINHVPEVEHLEAKSEGGKELDWENLLLSCKYCNTRKGVPYTMSVPFPEYPSASTAPFLT